VTTVREVAELLQRSAGTRVAVLDVRERHEFADRHLPGASPLPRGLMEFTAPAVLPDRDALLVLVSGQGRRAARAAEALAELGFANPRVLAGGLDGWRAAGLPIETGWGVAGKRYGERLAVPDLQRDAATVASGIREGHTLVVDIRPEWEHEQGHVPGAINLPGDRLASRLPEIAAIAQDRTIVTHCTGRTRGIVAADLLRRAGLPQAFALLNGCMGWVLAGKALEFGSTPPPVWTAGRGDGGWRLTERAPLASSLALPALPLLSADALQHWRAERGPHYLLDVRSLAEWRSARVPGALPLPAGQVLLEGESVVVIKSLPVALIAGSEAAARWAALHLRQLGVREIVALDGGIPAWLASGRAAPPHDARPAVPASARHIAVAAWRRDPARFRVIDVRSRGEWGMARLAGSECMPRGQLDAGGWHPGADARPVLLVSSAGRRASLAAVTLERLAPGLEIAVLEGGLRACRDAGFPIDTGGADPSIASRDTAGRVPAALWRMPLERTRPVMLRYIAWEEALAQDRGAG
jgi:rhodanese-related sulfurtransferase